MGSYIDKRKEQLADSSKGVNMNYFMLYKAEIKKRQEAEDKLKDYTSRNKLLGRYLMARSRQLRATGDEGDHKEANAVVAMCKGSYDNYAFTEVAPVRWVKAEVVDKNPDYYKVLDIGQVKGDTWMLIVPIKEYPVLPGNQEEAE